MNYSPDLERDSIGEPTHEFDLEVSTQHGKQPLAQYWESFIFAVQFSLLPGHLCWSWVSSAFGPNIKTHPKRDLLLSHSIQDSWADGVKKSNLPKPRELQVDFLNLGSKIDLKVTHFPYYIPSSFYFSLEICCTFRGELFTRLKQQEMETIPLMWRSAPISASMFW